MITFVPVGGLANRMRAIDSALRLAADCHTGLRIVWFKDHGLNCRFDELFQPIEAAVPTEVKDAGLADLCLLDRPRRRNFHIPRLPQQILFGNRFYEEEVKRLQNAGFDFRSAVQSRKNSYIASFLHFYTGSNPGKKFEHFRPVADLQQQIDRFFSQIDGQRPIGVHIRRTDHIDSIRNSPTEIFIEAMEQELRLVPETRFYLATDSDEEKERLIRRFGNHILCSGHTARRDSSDGIRDALVEMYILAGCRKILGSQNSSYSETAAEIGNITLQTIRKQG